MYTIISGTNRKQNTTLKISSVYQQIFMKMDVETKLLSLVDVFPEAGTDSFIQLEQEYLEKAETYVFIAPEYNGSIPGILKLLIDEAEWKTCWKNKKAMLVGVSTGRAGNLRGMDHLASILHHMNMQVMPYMLPLSKINDLINEEGNIVDDVTFKNMEQQVKSFIQF
jgi:chromate reductase, NAD(P)H dehydrogenase (quinone)